MPSQNRLRLNRHCRPRIEPDVLCGSKPNRFEVVDPAVVDGHPALTALKRRAHIVTSQ